MPELNPENSAGLHRAIVRKGSYIALGAMGLLVASGGLSFSDHPQRPTEECWSAVEEAFSDSSENNIPASIQALESLPPSPLVPNGEVNSAAFMVKPAELISRPNNNVQIGPFETIQSFQTLGGIQVHIRRDQAIPIHEANFTSTLETLLTAEYTNPHIQAHMWCFNEDLLAGKFANQTLHIRIPSSPYVCYGGMRLMPKQRGEDCNAAGVTYPNPKLFGRLLQPNTYITATASTVPGTDESTSNQQINRVLFHEITYHGYYSLLGEPFPITPNGWDYDEQYAKQHLNHELSVHLLNMPEDQQIIVPFDHS